MAREKDWSKDITIVVLLIIVLVCICLLGIPTYNNKANQAELEVAKQTFSQQVAAVDRKYEIRINNLQEQINSLQYIANKRYELMDDDIKRNQRDIDDLRERLKARKQ